MTITIMVLPGTDDADDGGGDDDDDDDHCEGDPNLRPTILTTTVREGPPLRAPKLILIPGGWPGRKSPISKV